MSSIIPVLVISIIAVLIALIIAGVRAGSEKGGEEMIKNVYIYLVLFATLMMTIGGSVGSFMAIADIVAPTTYYQTFEDFKRRETAPSPQPRNGEVVEQEKVSEQELRERYDIMVAHEKERQISRAKNSLIKSFGWIIIPLPVFIYYQRRLAKKED